MLELIPSSISSTGFRLFGDEILQESLLDELLNLLFRVAAILNIMTGVSMVPPV